MKKPRARRWLLVAILLLAVLVIWPLACLAQGKTGALGSSFRPSKQDRVFVHYMPWFRAEKHPDGYIEWEHWKWFGKGPKHDPDEFLENGHRDIASVYYPLVGPYDGRDPAVLEYHMLTAKAAGVDGFIADWYGPDDFSDQVFAAMVKAAERARMKVAVCLEEKTFFPPYADTKTKAEAQKVMESQIQHVLDTHGKSDAYLRRDGQPIFYIFKNYGTTGNLTPKETAEVLSRFGDGNVLLVRGGVDPAFFEAARGCYVWCPDGSNREDFYRAAGKAWEQNKFDYWVGGAYPGFDDHGCWGWGNGPRVVDRRGTLEYEETWNEVLRHRPPVIQISTWNDFEEGTTIEPSEQYGFTFVDLTEQFVEKFTGREADLDDNQWPWRLYQLRKKAESIADPDLRKSWNDRLDAYASDLADGSRFLMAWRLRNLEEDIRKVAVPGSPSEKPQSQPQPMDQGENP